MDEPNTQDNENLTTALGNVRAAGTLAPTCSNSTRVAIVETENGVKTEMDNNMEIDDDVHYGGNGNVGRAMTKKISGGRGGNSGYGEKKSNKRSIVYVLDCSGDEEEFAGFDACSDKKKRIKIKEEPLSDIDSTDERPPVKLEADIKKELEPELDGLETIGSPMFAKLPPPPKVCGSVTPSKGKLSNANDPRYRKPFKLGWKRELVLRAQATTNNKGGDVYYISPIGKRCRSKVEIISQLTPDDGLDVNDFWLIREPLGMSADEETVRSAKPQQPAVKKPVNFLDLAEPDPTLGFGKRVPKPKMPKGASPPPAQMSPVTNKARQHQLQQQQPVGLVKKAENLSEIDNKSKGPKTPKAKGEPCTIQCVLAMGTIPQLQCKKCLCLFHHECVGLDIYEGPIANYICESCLHELTVVASGGVPLHEASTSATTSTVTLPSATVQPQSVTTAITAPTMVAPTPEKSMKSLNRPASTPVVTASSRRNDNAKDPITGGGGGSGVGSVIGGMTSWVPPTANLASSRSQLDIDVTPPQSIAIVAGRKYILVPKTNLMSVSPSGEVKIGDNNGIPLSYFNSSAQQQQSQTRSTSAGATGLSGGISTPLTTGDDVTPPLKKRLLSRNASSKVQTPKSSPNTSAVTSPSAKITQLPPPSNDGGFGTKSGRAYKGAAATTANSTGVASSVHTLFATNFFNNISLGYNVLLHTFQYLKMQELLRASRVCRMWNHAANNSMQTVRMKNSQVNDWSGLANTLKRNGTKHLDLRKMLVPGMPDTIEQTWQKFSDNIGRVVDLETIDLCRLSSKVIESLWRSNPGLKVINAMLIKDDSIELVGLSQLAGLTELRLRSLDTLCIDSLSALANLTNLRHLSLTSISELGAKDVHVIGNLTRLETLELGECSELAAPFATQVLAKLTCLERLRLEKGQYQCCTFDILDAIAGMPMLKQLELVNFDIKPDFDTHLRPCVGIKRLLIIPTYISQSATTNHKILTGVLSLAKSLEQLTWVVTLELLRVTELYVDQIEVKRRDQKMPEDKIPVLKPVPGMSEEDKNVQATIEDAPQVHILPLDQVEKILHTHMPNTKFSIMKVPYHMTWRQNMAELQ